VGALAVTVMALTDRMSRARTHTIDRTALGVLRVAATRKGIRPTEIADELNVHPSSVTRHAQVLEQAGKVAIRPDPADGRASLIEVTPTGLADLWNLYEQGVDAFHDAIADWTPDEVRALAASMSRLIAALDARAKRQTEPERRPDQ
jgi:DNA-binding MarR family transcriptional regulator